MSNETQTPINTNLTRVRALIDKSAWLLIGIGVAGVAFTDWALLSTMWQWCLFTTVIGGLTIQMSRIMFPNVRLTEFVVKAQEGSVAAAIVVAATMGFTGLLFAMIIYWAKT